MARFHAHKEMSLVETHQEQVVRGLHSPFDSLSQQAINESERLNPTNNSNNCNTDKSVLQNIVIDINAAITMLSPQIAAEFIIQSIFRNTPISAGSVHYHIKSQRWLSLILESEENLDLSLVLDRLISLSAISNGIKQDIDKLITRLVQIQIS
jgi:hypothetical protein